MCAYQTLSFDEKNGYVIYCPSCRHLQLAFGCMLLYFGRDEFERFKKIIDEIAHDFADVPDSVIKTITIPTPCEGLCLYLSLKELRALYHLSDEAKTQLQANDLISLFYAQ